MNSALELKVAKIDTTDTVKDESEDIKLETTFNLGLKLSEKKAKTEVELPFWRPEQKVNQMKSQSQKGGSSGGEIIYIADEIDDCDEEDPDDEAKNCFVLLECRIKTYSNKYPYEFL